MREIRLYFISSAGRIKIGITVDVQRRFHEIGKHMENPIYLIGNVPGSYGLEKHLHSVLADHALGHEWFKDCAEVRSLMGSVLAGEDVGFTPKEVRADPVAAYELTPERWLARFNAFAKMMWPAGTAERLAEFLETDREKASLYLTGDEELPDLFWKAFSSHFVQWMLSERLRQQSMQNS